MHRGPLPDYLVETLFAQLGVTWGTAFLDQYKGVDLLAVRDDWARQLGGFYEPEAADGQGDAPAIRWALEHLPSRPVNVLEFRKLCVAYLAPNAAALPAPRGPIALPPQVAQVFAGLREGRPNEEPAQVRRARYTVSRLEGRREMSPLHHECVGAARTLIERWERSGVLPT